jgi:excisionase family DNA binding protein
VNGEAYQFPRKFYSVDETAHMMGCTTVSLRRWIKQGRIGSIKIGGRRLIPASVIDNLADPVIQPQERRAS